MIFNSVEYALFFPIVFVVYWLLGKKLRLQNIFAVVASYVFYAWWDWRFLGLLIGMSLISWLAGELLTKNCSKFIARFRKTIMWSAVVTDVAILGFFKYYNFFLESFGAIFNLQSSNLNLILPLGISFYTFQSVAYVVDAYHNKLSISPSKFNNLVNCFLYIAFFPKLLAGPIERPANLLPQIQHKRVFEYDTAVDGCRQILWGLFKKMVVADNCAIYVNSVYSDYANQSASTLLLAAILYTIQIYGDFSGIAI